MNAAHQATTTSEDQLDLFRSPQSPSDLEKKAPRPVPADGLCGDRWLETGNPWLENQVA
ncbi:hypothetical protein [Pseudomonas aeruginosa]|uniref:hypothetical protein n=1 Tax=Pseudomonas aeruginosa TaxID=287 RepID=UPI001BD48DF5|nr:hypothetical protein [Pseudomonas aeruginosa]HEP9579909.1 hypothetical protein [Pseudomonas aeruginosa]